jgi:glutaredoxin
MGIDVYGADWCGDCTRAKMLLDRHGVTYNWIDTDADEDARAKAIEISGLQKIPVIVFPNGEFLSEPSNPQIEEQLKANNLLD